MEAFEYASPSNLKEAYGLLGATWSDAAILAGGTDLISMMKDYMASPKRVVNIKGIKELGGIKSSGGGLRIGAIVTIDELVENSALRSGFPALHEAVRQVGSTQIRNMGTLGGNLCQRPRCWYFRGGYGLLGMKDGKSLVMNGENKYHAIFPQGAAMFVSASTLAPALIALNARVKIASAKGAREIGIDKLFVAPQSNDQREIALQANEILAEVVIPSTKMKNATYELRHRDTLDWPLATASVALDMNGATVRGARIVMGHVGPTPVISEEAAKWLAGKSITAETAEKAGEVAVSNAKPLSQNAYKVHLAKVAVKRALMLAAGIKA